MYNRFYAGNDPQGFVVSMNLARRHLDEGQRAMVAARLANVPHGGLREGNPKHEIQAANLPLDVPAISQAKAAELLNVSERSLRTAKKVIEQAAPELAKGG